MSLQLTPTTIAYRSAVASAAAGGAPIAPLAFMAFGQDGMPYNPDTDTALHAEFVRVPISCTIQGATVVARGVLTGAQTGNRVVREAGVFTSNGVLVGRRALAQKELESETEMEVEIHFEY